MMYSDFILWFQKQTPKTQFWTIAGIIGTFAVLILFSFLWDKYKEKIDE